MIFGFISPLGRRGERGDEGEGASNLCMCVWIRNRIMDVIAGSESLVFITYPIDR